MHRAHAHYALPVHSYDADRWSALFPDLATRTIAVIGGWTDAEASEALGLDASFGMLLETRKRIAVPSMQGLVEAIPVVAAH